MAGADPGNVVSVPQTYNQHRRRRAHGRYAGRPGRVLHPGSPPVGGVVIDPFAGSGTTIVVARRLGRRAGGLDIHADYVEEAKHRIADDRPDDPPRLLEFAF